MRYIYSINEEQRQFVLKTPSNRLKLNQIMQLNYSQHPMERQQREIEEVMFFMRNNAS